MSIHSAAGQDIEPIYKTVARALNDALPGKPQPLVFKGIFYTDWAWEARGGGLPTPSPKKDGSFSPSDWRWPKRRCSRRMTWTPMIPPPLQTNDRRMGQGKGVMDVWFDRAMKADPDNYEAAMSKLLYIEPKWNGSPQQMLRFGEECLRSGDYAGQMPMVLSNAHKALAAYAQRPETYFATPAVWADIQRVYEPYLRVSAGRYRSARRLLLLCLPERQLEHRRQTVRSSGQ